MPWRKLYESCVSETNPNKLEKLVLKLEEAIVLRYHDLAREPKGSDELQAIRRAAERLIQLKTEKLGWPDPANKTPTCKVRQPRQLWTNRRTLVSRIRAALVVTELAWQKWVFKSAK